MEQHVPRMNPLQARAWLALVSTAELLPNVLDAQLTAHAGLINFEYGVLSILNVAPDRTLRMGELGTALDAAAPRLSKAVTRLEGKGLVERIPCRGDRRSINVHLTRDGRRAWLKATPPHIAFARDDILESFSETELESLSELLERVLKRLDPRESLWRLPQPPAAGDRGSD